MYKVPQPPRRTDTSLMGQPAHRLKKLFLYGDRGITNVVKTVSYYGRAK